MVNTLFTQGRALAAPLAVAFANIQAWMDGLLVRAEVPPVEGQPKSSLPVWAIILIGAVVLICLASICIVAVLMLLGPAIGNVFSNINEGL